MARKNDAAIRQLLYSPRGAVGRDLSRRLLRVQNQAKVNAPVDVGRLRSSITTTDLYVRARGLTGAVGSNVVYALAVHEGSGSPYAPRSWKIAAARGNPIPGRPFLVNALSAARS